MTTDPAAFSSDDRCDWSSHLEDLSAGRLSSQNLSALADHVSRCPACQRELQDLDSQTGTLTRILRQAAGAKAARPADSLDARLDRLAVDVPRNPADAGSPRHSEHLPLPAKIGKYEILARIGQGGMGTVYRARHPHLDKVVAVKVLATHHARTAEAIQRFQSERRALGQVTSPRIVGALDADVDGQQLFLVMEYIAGIDLSRLCRSVGRLEVAEACEVVRQAALGLEVAHAAGLVHRDVKPSNLLLQTGTPTAPAPIMVKLLDFGLAKLRSQPGEGKTSSSTLLGTLDYMSPEQMQSSAAVDVRTDIYSLGCTLFALLAGRAPFAGLEYSNFAKKMHAHLYQPLPDLRQFCGDVPESLLLLLNEMTAKSPESRPQSAEIVNRRLEEFCRGADLPGLVSRNNLEQSVDFSERSQSQSEPQSGAEPGSRLELRSGLSPSPSPSSESESESRGRSPPLPVDRLPADRPVRRWSARLGSRVFLGGLLVTLLGVGSRVFLKGDKVPERVVPSASAVADDDASSRPASTASGADAEQRSSDTSVSGKLVPESVQIADSVADGVAKSGTEAILPVDGENLFVGALSATTGDRREPGSGVMAPPGLKSPIVYLTELPEKVLVSGPWGYGKGKLGSGWKGTEGISMFGNVYHYGLGMHPFSKSAFRVEYPLKGRFQKLIGEVAIAQNTRKGPVYSPITFEVWGDGRKLWNSKPIQKWLEAVLFSVDVRAVQTLELRVVCPGLNENAQCFWLDPYLEPVGYLPPSVGSGVVEQETKPGPSGE